MESVESVVIRQRNVGAMVQKQRQHVVPFFRNRIMQGCISFRILKQPKKNKLKFLAKKYEILLIKKIFFFHFCLKLIRKFNHSHSHFQYFSINHNSDNRVLNTITRWSPHSAQTIII